PWDETNLFAGVGNHLSPETLAGHAEMNGAGREMARDFRGGQIGDFDAVETGDRAAIVARPAWFDQSQPGAREERFGVFLQPPFGRDSENKRPAHRAPP